MALPTTTFRLDAAADFAAGRSAPANKLNLAQVFSGGTSVLTDNGGHKVWRFSGANSTSNAPARTATVAESGSGVTLVIRAALSTYTGSDKALITYSGDAAQALSYAMGWYKTTPALSEGVAFGGGGNPTIYDGGGVDVGSELVTLVIRYKKNAPSYGYHACDLWWSGGGGTSTADKSVNNVDGLNAVFNHVHIVPSAGQIDIRNFDILAGEVTDVEAAAIVANYSGVMDPVGDTTAPTLTGSITVGTVTSTSIAISWPAGSDNTAVTAYETSTDGSTWTPRGNVLSYTFTGLTPSTSYTLRVRAKDAAGNVSTPALSVTQSTSAASVYGFDTPQIKNNTGTLLASTSGWTANVYHSTTGALIARITGISTNAAGVARIEHASLADDASYSYELVHATYGRRLPVAVAS